MTMGGEPTFISIDDMEGAEWNIAAVGPNKRRLSETLIRRLHKRYAPGGLLHFGQGKWYPGESLITITFAEKDGETEMTTTMRYESTAARDGVLKSPMEGGVKQSYDRLAAIVEKAQAS